MPAPPRVLPAAAVLLGLTAAGCSGAAPPRARPPEPAPAAAPAGPAAAPAPAPGTDRRPTGPSAPTPRALLFAGSPPAEDGAGAGEDGAGGPPAGLPSSALAASSRLTYLARDGLEIPALLTLPPGLPPRGLPLVVLVRSRAAGRPRSGFDPRVQLLASRGYAVLRPDGRGAGVPGAHPAAAGDPWSSAALDDLADGVVELVRRGIADGDRVAIAGEAYGGWAALASVALTPDLYAAAVALDAPPELGSLVVAGGPADGAAVPAAYPVRRPPPARAGDVRAPLLLARSADAPAPRPAATDALAAAVRPGCRELEYLLTPPGSGGAAEGSDRLTVWAAVELFLSRHLGGRLEEIPAELARRVAALRVDVTALPPAVRPPAHAAVEATVEAAGAVP